MMTNLLVRPLISKATELNKRPEQSKHGTFSQYEIIQISTSSDESDDESVNQSNSNLLIDYSPILSIKYNFTAWVGTELKNYASNLNISTLYSLPNNINLWTTSDVHLFLRTLGFCKTADRFAEENIDGIALLLLRREDLLDRLALKIGIALKLGSIVEKLRDYLNDAF